MPAVRVLGAVGGIVLAILLLGCSSPSAGHPSHSASQTASATATGRTSAQPTCALVPASLVNTTLGSDVGAPAQTLNGSVTVCEYNGAKAGHVIVRFQTGEDAASFATGRKGFDSNGEPTKTVTGFADEAYSSTLGTGDRAVVTLVARAGPVEILVTSSAGLDAEEALEKQLFAKL